MNHEPHQPADAVHPPQAKRRPNPKAWIWGGVAVAIILVVLWRTLGGGSGSVSRPLAMSCVQYQSLDTMQRLEVVRNVHRQLGHTGRTYIRQLSVQELDAQCGREPARSIGDIVGQ